MTSETSSVADIYNDESMEMSGDESVKTNDDKFSKTDDELLKTFIVNIFSKDDVVLEKVGHYFRSCC